MFVLVELVSGEDNELVARAELICGRCDTTADTQTAGPQMATPATPRDNFLAKWDWKNTPSIHPGPENYGGPPARPRARAPLRAGTPERDLRLAQPAPGGPDTSSSSMGDDHYSSGDSDPDASSSSSPSSGTSGYVSRLVTSRPRPSQARRGPQPNAEEPVPELEQSLESESSVSEEDEPDAGSSASESSESQGDSGDDSDSDSDSDYDSDYERRARRERARPSASLPPVKKPKLAARPSLLPVKKPKLAAKEAQLSPCFTSAGARAERLPRKAYAPRTGPNLLRRHYPDGAEGLRAFELAKQQKKVIADARYYQRTKAEKTYGIVPPARTSNTTQAVLAVVGALNNLTDQHEWQHTLAALLAEHDGYTYTTAPSYSSSGCNSSSYSGGGNCSSGGGGNCSGGGGGGGGCGGGDDD